MKKLERTFHQSLEQGTDEWFLARLGKVTASEFKSVMSKGRGSAPSKTRETYMTTLMAERLTGIPQESFTNHHMERGKEQEAEARELYEMSTGTQVDQIGFISMGPDIGCSPDGMINSNGMAEIKCRLGKIQVPLCEADREGKAVVPPENMAQIQGGLWVAQREWCDYISYSPGLPLVVIRTYRDEKHIGQISSAVFKFLDEMNGRLKKFK